MKKTLTIISILFLYLFTACIEKGNTSHANYYIDNQTGNDKNSGTNPKEAWKTFEGISHIKLHPGDQVLLKSGQTFQGSIRIDSAQGTSENPIIFNTYGGGRATIQSGDSLAFLARHCRYLVFKNINVLGSGRLKGNKANGIEFLKVHHGLIDSVEASGYLYSGVRITGGSDLQVKHVYAHDNGFCGIDAESGEPEYGSDGSKFKTLKKVYIGWCKAVNNPGCPVIKDNHSGNGILMGGVVYGTIEYCEASENGWDMPRDGNGPVGIWAYMSDSVTIQYCYAHHNKTSATGKDGGGFDFDGGMTNSVMQYNLSAFNEGAGYGIFQYAGATAWRSNYMRYNISYNDGSKNSHAGIFMWCDPAALPMQNFQSYNNTIVSNQGLAVNFDPGEYKGFRFENNIFLVSKVTDRFIDGKFTKANFRRNIYWAMTNALEKKPQPAIQIDKEALVANPALDLPAKDDIWQIQLSNQRNLSFFRLTKESVCLRNGNVIPGNGGRDFWCKPVSADEKPNLGADGE